MTNEKFIDSIRLEGEEWREIPEWERYAASSLGRIASLGAPYICGDRICRRKPQLLTPRLTKESPHYFSVVLSNGDRGRKSFLVHCLVARTFIPNYDNLPFINHKDENPRNNRVDNLEWCTQKYNCNYGTHNERMAKTISETAYQRRKVVQLSLTGDLISRFESITLAGRSLGVGPALISSCCRGITRSGYGYRWMYLQDYEKSISSSTSPGQSLGTCETDIEPSV